MNQREKNIQKDILAVDDDSLSHQILRQALKDENYFIRCVNNAQEAIDHISDPSHHYSAFIFDWEMPGMSGIDLLRWVKEQPSAKHVPAIMLTSNSESDKIKTGIDAGAYYYITKPFNKALLISVIRNAVAEFASYESLLDQLAETRNPFSNLEHGLFRIQKPEDAEKLAVLIANACPVPEEAMIVSELLNNAIEHGNLGITYEEKTALIDTDKLKAEIEHRLMRDEYKNKFAEIVFERKPQMIRVVITDQGGGFDFRKYLHFDESRVFDNHGRGIAMVNSYLDIEYHGTGNCVEVRIPLKP